MKPIGENCNIVIVGAWNPKIFSGEWVKNHLSSEEGQIELALPFSNIEAPPRISFDGIYLFPGTARLEVKPINFSNESLQDCQQVVASILEKLPHTPVLALGINFSFLEEDNFENIIGEFQLSDNAKINAARYNLSGTRLNRSFEMPDNCTLNLTITYDSDKATVDFNYNFDVVSTAIALDKLNSLGVIAYLEDAKNFVTSVYELEFEEIADDH